MLEKFLHDRRGISAMQDAVLFCVMVSIAGAILVPAFTSTIPRSTHQEVEQQKMAEEALVSLLSTRLPYLEYSITKESISIRGAIAETTVFQSLNSFATKRVVLHQPYGALIAECLASQLYFFGDRINPIAVEYDIVLKKRIGDFFDGCLGNDYKYHLTSRWQPLKGLPVGGNLSVGYPAPSNAATAETKILMPLTPGFTAADGDGEILFSKDVLDENIDEGNIQQIVERYHGGGLTRQQAEEKLFQNISHNITKLYLSGFGALPSIVNLTLQYCFNLHPGMIDVTTVELDACDTVLNQTTGGMIYRPQLKEILNTSLSSFSDTIQKYDGIWAADYSQQLDNDENVSEKLATFMNFTWKLAEKEIEDNALLKPYVENEVEQLLSTTPDETGEEYMDWLYKMVGIYHAKVSLSIWRA